MYACQAENKMRLELARKNFFSGVYGGAFVIT
jgi:hypothetical protein